MTDGTGHQRESTQNMEHADTAGTRPLVLCMQRIERPVSVSVDGLAMAHASITCKLGTGYPCTALIETLASTGCQGGEH
jgi:hypothetical protein